MKLRVTKVSLDKAKLANKPGEPRYYSIDGAFSFETSGNARPFLYSPERAREVLLSKLKEVLETIEIEVEEEE